MANKPAPSAAPKAPKGASNVILSSLSGSKVEVRTGSMGAEKRRLMIAEAAFYLSERRGFETGREMEDWLLAEKQIDALLSGNTVGARAA